MISRAEPNFRRTAERDITPPHNRHYVLFACMSFDIFAGARRLARGTPSGAAVEAKPPYSGVLVVAIPMPQRRRARASKRSLRCSVGAIEVVAKHKPASTPEPAEQSSVVGRCELADRVVTSVAIDAAPRIAAAPRCTEAIADARVKTGSSCSTDIGGTSGVGVRRPQPPVKLSTGHGRRVPENLGCSPLHAMQRAPPDEVAKPSPRLVWVAG